MRLGEAITASPGRAEGPLAEILADVLAGRGAVVEQFIDILAAQQETPARLASAVDALAAASRSLALAREKPFEVTVAAPGVTVEAPQVRVEPNVSVELPRVRRTVERDAAGQITAVIEEPLR